MNRPFGRLADGNEVEVLHAGPAGRPAGGNPHARWHAAQPDAAGARHAEFRWSCRCPTCRPISRTLPILASWSAAMATASAAPPSSSTASTISSPPTTGRTRCTAATWASASTYGRCWARAAARTATSSSGIARPRASMAFPGNLDVTALISVLDNTLTLAYEATTDAPTPINLTWHPYFNLSGDPGRDIDEQRLLHERQPLSTHQRLARAHRRDRAGRRHALRFPQAEERARAAAVVAPADRARRRIRSLLGARQASARRTGRPRSCISPASGVRMAVRTNLPGLQVYGAYHLKTAYPGWHAICLEPENFPDAPNHANFPSSILRPGETHRSFMSFRFRRDDTNMGRVKAAFLHPKYWPTWLGLGILRRVRTAAAPPALSTGPRTGPVHPPVPHAVQAHRPAQHRAGAARARRTRRAAASCANTSPDWAARCSKPRSAGGRPTNGSGASREMTGLEHLAGRAGHRAAACCCCRRTSIPSRSAAARWRRACRST